MKITADELIRFVKLLIYPAFIYLNIDLEIVGIWCFFMLIDTFTGSLKAIRLKELFSTKKLMWGLVSKMLILLIPIGVALIGKALSYDFAILIGMTIRVMIVTEFYSFLGNIYSIKTCKKVNKIDAISLMIKGLRKTMSSFLQNSIRKIEDAGDCKMNKEDE